MVKRSNRIVLLSVHGYLSEFENYGAASVAKKCAHRPAANYVVGSESRFVAQLHIVPFCETQHGWELLKRNMRTYGAALLKALGRTEPETLYKEVYDVTSDVEDLLDHPPDTDASDID